MKYGTVIYVCRVQEVVDYVKELVASLRKWMLRVVLWLFFHAQNVLKSVCLTIHDIEGQEIESFVIIHSENTLRVTDAIDFDRVNASAWVYCSLRNHFGVRFCCSQQHPLARPCQVQSLLWYYFSQCSVFCQHGHKQGNRRENDRRMGICWRSTCSRNVVL